MPKRKKLDDWRQITQQELSAAMESIIDSPPPSGEVRDRRTGSVGVVLGDLGFALDERGKSVQKVYVEVTEPQAWHKKGDPVIWRNPVSLQ